MSNKIVKSDIKSLQICTVFGINKYMIKKCGNHVNGKKRMKKGIKMKDSKILIPRQDCTLFKLEVLR